MKRTITNYMIFFCFYLVQTATAQQKNALRYEVMLNKNMLDTLMIKDHFMDAIDISPNKYITLSTGNKIFLLGWGGLTQFGKDIDGGVISSFTHTNDGLFMAVKSNQLYYMNDLGNLDTLVYLPKSDMGIAAGKEVVYLFDQNRNDKQYKLYAYAKGGKYKQLLVSPKPITTAVEMSDSLYLAIGSGVFSLSSKNNTLNLVAGFDKENEIRSLTVDPINSILYIATYNAIYALQNNSLVYVTGDFGGGIIKYFSQGLIIFNPVTCDIIRIVNIDKSIKF